MNLIDVHKTFKTDDECVEYLANLRWPDGVRCVTCGTDKVRQYASPTEKQPNRKIYQCQEPTCQQQFTATSGTIFHDTHLPLTKWFLALSIVVDAKKGISAKQWRKPTALYCPAPSRSTKCTSAVASADTRESGPIKTWSSECGSVVVLCALLQPKMRKQRHFTTSLRIAWQKT